MRTRETIAVIEAMARTSTKPVAAEVLRVHDGDTWTARVPGWPEPFQKMLIRLAEVDAPELNDSRLEIATIALRSLGALSKYLYLGGVLLTSIRPDKYFRLLCTVQVTDIADVGARMESEGYVRPYKGRGPKPW